MSIPESLIAAVGVYKLLIVLTSAIFAIAHYYENRQRKMIEKCQSDLKELDLEGAEINAGMGEVKKQWEAILNIQPIHNQAIIFPALSLIVLYTVLFVTSLLSEWLLLVGIDVQGFVALLLKLSSLVLLVSGGWLFVNCIRMKRQTTEFKKDAGNLRTLYQVVTKAINNN